MKHSYWQERALTLLLFFSTSLVSYLRFLDGIVSDNIVVCAAQHRRFKPLLRCRKKPDHDFCYHSSLR